MSTTVRSSSGPGTAHASEPTVTALVTGILSDAQALFKQELALFKSEVRAEIIVARKAALALSLGVGLMALGGVLLCFMAAHFLSWVFEMPFWGGFAIVGGVLVVVGLALYGLGRQKLGALHPVPEQTVQSLKENVQWLKTPR
jgi:hypothetical protein